MDGLNIFTAITTFLIAAIALYIAWQQYLSNKHIAERELALNIKKIDLELYEKRYNIYIEARKFVTNIISKGLIIDEFYWEFINKTNESTFLFGNEVTVFLDEIKRKAEEKTKIKELLEVIDNTSPDYKKAKKDNSQLFNWFCDLKMESVFMKYLNFNNLNI